MPNDLFSILFPKNADNTVHGSKIPLYLFILIAAVGTVRSFIHILSPDGGAGSIAGMNLAVSGANEVIFAFALWGGEQLVYALLQWLVIWRYRALLPLMWIAQFIESLLRILVGKLKPVSFAHTPPGAYQNYFYIVLSLLMVALALWSGYKELRVRPSM